MSKGLGRVERAILAALSHKRGKKGRLYPSADAEHLARYVRLSLDAGPVPEMAFYEELYRGQPATRSQLEATRRALRSLLRKGLIVQAQLVTRRTFFREAGHWRVPFYPD